MNNVSRKLTPDDLKKSIDIPKDIARELKGIGVEVCFIEDNIWTMDEDTYKINEERDEMMRLRAQKGCGFVNDARSSIYCGKRLGMV